MIVDLVMGLSSVLIGIWLLVCSAPLADFMQEGDERIRERNPWVEAFEPRDGYFATADGRWWMLRGWLIGAALAFEGVGLALVLRGAL